MYQFFLRITGLNNIGIKYHFNTCLSIIVSDKMKNILIGFVNRMQTERRVAPKNNMWRKQWKGDMFFSHGS